MSTGLLLLELSLRGAKEHVIVVVVEEMRGDDEEFGELLKGEVGKIDKGGAGNEDRRDIGTANNWEQKRRVEVRNTRRFEF